MFLKLHKFFPFQIVSSAKADDAFESMLIQTCLYVMTSFVMYAEHEFELLPFIKHAIGIEDFNGELVLLHG